MCGICGSVGPKASPARVTAMLQQMAHRGPDGEGLWQNGDWVLGHKRLAIVDLSEAGRQPMFSRDGRLAAVVNGEIYNHAALRKELEAAGAVFVSKSDSEVVLHAYRAWGRDSFIRLNGMFAFALADVERRAMFLVRDRLGIKPLYYCDAGADLTFASEIKGLVAANPERRWSIDATGLGQYLTFQNLIGAKSLFQSVRSVKPGCFLEVDGGRVAEHAYWQPSFANIRKDASIEDAVGEFKAVFRASVGRHLMSDVPVSSYLSSGFDSTMVASEAARQLGSAPSVFTGKFPEGGWYDEVEGARLVAKLMGADLNEVAIDAAGFARVFDDVVAALDEPRMGMGALPQYLVAETAAKRGKVILTGHGGDELFSGYPVFKMALLADSASRGVGATLEAMRALRRSELPHLAYFGAQRARGGIGAHFLPVLFPPSLQQRALQPDVLRKVRDSWAVDDLTGIAEASRSAYEQILLTYLKVYLPGLLIVEDKISMAHSLESRTPLLDNAMLDLSLSLPAAIKLDGGQLKAVIKAAARDVLPPRLFELPKRGFPTPLGRWLRGPLQPWMRDRLCAPGSALTRLFREDFLKATVERYVAAMTARIRPLDEVPTHRMWMLLCLESWLRQHETRYGVTLRLE